MSDTTNVKPKKTIAGKVSKVLTFLAVLSLLSHGSKAIMKWVTPVVPKCHEQQTVIKLEEVMVDDGRYFSMNDITVNDIKEVNKTWSTRVCEVAVNIKGYPNEYLGSYTVSKLDKNNQFTVTINR